MKRNRVGKTYSNNGLDTTPISRKFDGQPPFLNERNLAFLGLLFSLMVISVKIAYEHYNVLESIFFERKLISYEVITESGQVMFTNTWKSAIRFSNVWLPLICGFLATYFTWMCVYLDSKEPGVNPPSPLSPQKYKARSGHSFHLNYLFAILVGILVTGYMYLKGAAI